MRHQQAGLTISVIDPDPHYLGILIRAWNALFSGSTFIYANFDELSEFALSIAGFPSHIPDERVYEFGTRGGGGGYCGLHLHTTDHAGHAELEVDIEGEKRFTDHRSYTKLYIPIEAAAIDRFVQGLHDLEIKKMAL